eukprot:scaffold10077_cov160-Amphora_coffeaeformis.AAC.2
MTPHITVDDAKDAVTPLVMDEPPREDPADTRHHFCVVALSFQRNILQKEKDNILATFSNLVAKKKFLAREKRVGVAVIDEIRQDNGEAEEYLFVFSLFFEEGNYYDDSTLGHLVT